MVLCVIKQADLHLTYSGCSHKLPVLCLSAALSCSKCASQVGVTPPLEADECVNAVSYLWWCQQLSGDETLWGAVAKSSKALKEEKSKKSGLAFWHRVLKDFQSPPYTVSDQESISHIHKWQSSHSMHV